MEVYDDDSLRLVGVDKLDSSEGDPELDGLSKKLILLLLLFVEEVIDSAGEAGEGTVV